MSSNNSFKNKIPNKFFTFKKFRGSLNKFPDFFRMGTFSDSTHMKLYPTSK